MHAIVFLSPKKILKTTSGKIQRQPIKNAFIRGELQGICFQWTAASAPVEAAVAENSEENLANNRPLIDIDEQSLEQWFINWIANESKTVRIGAKVET